MDKMTDEEMLNELAIRLNSIEAVAERDQVATSIVKCSEIVKLLSESRKGMLTEERKFIRFGDPPADGKSTIYRNGEIAEGREDGVSVYEAVVIDGKLRILVPSLKTSAIVSLEWVLCRPMYEVTGTICGYGSDGEPLLKDCAIINDLTERKGRG